MKYSLSCILFASFFLQSCPTIDVKPIIIHRTNHSVDNDSGFFSCMRVKNAEQYPYEFIALIGQVIVGSPTNPEDIQLEDTTIVNKRLREHTQLRFKL